MVNSAQCPVLEFRLKTGKLIVYLAFYNKLYKFASVFRFILFLLCITVSFKS